MTELTYIFKIVSESEDKTVSLWYSSRIEQKNFLAELRRSSEFHETTHGWVVHRATSTIVLRSADCEFKRAPFGDSLLDTSFRLLIAKVPSQCVEDVDFVRQLWFDTFPFPHHLFTRALM